MAGDEKLTELNPKLHRENPNNADHDTQNWGKGNHPMTAPQASYLKALAEEAGEPEAYREDMSEAYATSQIDRLREKMA
ncbi:hypothetical protein A7A08_02384 [Methyloligella halotolerans]|uniref:DUF3072 domain-containing protein n=1 Tax=Methyloligella halotolerans TaxID=1177755 RepID=A0A1E2RWI1_9HYPH|nr:DUF3072 domain-containing protein [Methyloligella halotolerans]ODA66616.1 hypothetical protein A7A08_02384 [Methyloligella halotolerans]